MSEEIRREGELRDQDLEGVSGGGASVEWVKTFYCGKCVARTNSRLCLGSAEQLTDYYNQNGGRYAVSSPGNCPFLYHS